MRVLATNSAPDSAFLRISAMSSIVSSTPGPHCQRRSAATSCSWSAGSVSQTDEQWRAAPQQRLRKQNAGPARPNGPTGPGVQPRRKWRQPCGHSSAGSHNSTIEASIRALSAPALRQQFRCQKKRASKRFPRVDLPRRTQCEGQPRQIIAGGALCFGDPGWFAPPDIAMLARLG